MAELFLKEHHIRLVIYGEKNGNCCSACTIDHKKPVWQCKWRRAINVSMHTIEFFFDNFINNINNSTDLFLPCCLYSLRTYLKSQPTRSCGSCGLSSRCLRNRGKRSSGVWWRLISTSLIWPRRQGRDFWKRPLGWARAIRILPVLYRILPLKPQTNILCN